MTAVNSLVLKVGDAIRESMVGGKLQPETAAQAALDACHATELETALRNLLEDTQHRNHQCDDTEENCPVLRARALLAKLDGKPTERTA